MTQKLVSRSVSRQNWGLVRQVFSYVAPFIIYPFSFILFRNRRHSLSTIFTLRPFVTVEPTGFHRENRAIARLREQVCQPFPERVPVALSASCGLFAQVASEESFGHATNSLSITSLRKKRLFPYEKPAPERIPQDSLGQSATPATERFRRARIPPESLLQLCGAFRRSNLYGCALPLDKKNIL